MICRACPLWAIDHDLQESRERRETTQPRAVLEYRTRNLVCRCGFFPSGQALGSLMNILVAIRKHLLIPSALPANLSE